MFEIECITQENKIIEASQCDPCWPEVLDGGCDPDCYPG